MTPRVRRGVGWAALLLMALVLPLRDAAAEPFVAGAALDQTMVADVAAAGLAFLLPRTLDAIPPGELSLWGLRGMATLDPRLTPELRAGEVRLSLLAAPAAPAARLLMARKLPDSADPAVWGEMIAALVRAAWDASQPVRRAGTNGILEVLFDEICNHLDPYSRYLSPGQVQPGRDMRADLGLDVAAGRRGLVVQTVTADGPATAAGIRPGDVLIAIDGQELAGAAADDIPALLAGPEGSTVLLRMRDRAGRISDVTLHRAVPAPQTVRVQTSGPLLILKIDSFATDTATRIARALTASAAPTASAKAGAPAGPQAAGPRRKHLRGVVMDLRGNRGGLLRQAAAVAEAFLPEGTIAVTLGRDPAANHAFRAAGKDLAQGAPVVVLVDGGSASTAEILAAALADQHRAVVVGSATVGKGLVQAVSRLPNGGELLVTWSRVLAPLGWPIQGLGVLPQVCTSRGPEQLDGQLAALDGGEQPLAGPLSRHRAARAPLGTAEALALRAVCPAAEGGQADLAAARFLIDHPMAYVRALLGPPS